MFKITATELPRFMACNGSRLMGVLVPPNESDTARDEGDAVHWIAEQVFKGVITADELIDRKAPNGVYITVDMVEHVSTYLNSIMGRGSVERDTSHTDGAAWRVGGRVDHESWEGGTLYIDDFKYGWRIVSPVMNWTMISHAVALAKQANTMPDEVVFRIFQPRPYHPEGYVREWCCNADEFRKLFERLIETLLNPNDRLQTSQHCYGCLSRSQCPANQITEANSIDVSERVYNNVIDNDTLVNAINEIERATKVLKESLDAYHDLAISRLKSGQVIKGFALTADLGNLDWKEGLTPEVMKLLTGKDLSKSELITPTQAKKLGIDVDAFSERRNKGVKMVRMDSAKNAEKHFGKRK